MCNAFKVHWWKRVSQQLLPINFKYCMMTRPYSTDSSRWKAVSSRDGQAVGHFVYCVKTTKIYCRPNCPARLARRANVTFCDTGAEAATAGYRACHRCHPDFVSFEPQRDEVAKACKIIRGAHLGGRALKLEDLAAAVGLSKGHFHRMFKQHTGLTPAAYRQNLCLYRNSAASVRRAEASLVVQSNEQAPSINYGDLIIEDWIEEDMLTLESTPLAESPQKDLDWQEGSAQGLLKQGSAVLDMEENMVYSSHNFAEPGQVEVLGLDNFLWQEPIGAEYLTDHVPS